MGTYHVPRHNRWQATLTQEMVAHDIAFPGAMLYTRENSEDACATSICMCN